MRKISFLLISLIFGLAACAAPTEEPPNWEGYDPFTEAQPQAAVPLSTLLPPTRVS